MKTLYHSILDDDEKTVNKINREADVQKFLDIIFHRSARNVDLKKLDDVWGKLGLSIPSHNWCASIQPVTSDYLFYCKDKEIHHNAARLCLDVKDIYGANTSSTRLVIIKRTGDSAFKKTYAKKIEKTLGVKYEQSKFNYLFPLIEDIPIKDKPD